MRVDDSLALPSPQWLVCRGEHSEDAMNSSVILDGQQFSASPGVLKDSLDFRKLVYFGSRNIVVSCSWGIEMV